MSLIDEMRNNTTELIRLVRESAIYCATVAARPDLATAESHQKEVAREVRISELSRRLGITA